MPVGTVVPVGTNVKVIVWHTTVGDISTVNTSSGGGHTEGSILAASSSNQFGSI